MRLKSTGGRVVHDPLSFSFQMLELGGSPSQKYDVVSASYVPNRELTPYQLRPQLMISDPEHVIAAGDYASYMVNVVWSLTLATQEEAMRPDVAEAHLAQRGAQLVRDLRMKGKIK